MAYKTNKRECDFCKKKVNKWDISTIKKIQKFPGEHYNQCSSDFKTNTTCLAGLCPECMKKLENLIYKQVSKTNSPQ